jgi:hypothetical protein
MTMHSLIKYLFIVLIIASAGCERSKKLNNFFQPAPVEPLADVIRTSIPLGYCATVAMADQMGFPIPYETVSPGSGFSLIRITPSDDYPMVYLEDYCQEIMILTFPADEDFSILSLFFIYDESSHPRARVFEIHTIPCMVMENNIKVVFASQDVYLKDEVELDLHMGLMSIQIELERAENPKPETTEAAVSQNAWIIDVDPSGTWNHFADDSYTITGGEQDVSILTGWRNTETSMIQLAIMETQIQPDCILAPVNGFAVLSEIGVDTGPRESVEDLVMGTVFYQFSTPCTGKVNIQLATGNYVTSIGKKVELGLID